MEVEDLTTENDILIYIGERLKAFLKILNKAYNTQNLVIYGAEYNICYYNKRVDLMVGNKDMLIPIELKIIGNIDGYYQIKKYIQLLQRVKNKKINGILMCKHATKELKHINKNNEIMIIELESMEAW